jgi:hypothetical protein
MKSILILFIFISSALFSQDEFVTVTSSVNRNHIIIEYYEAKFIVEDSVEYVDWKLNRNLTYEQSNNEYTFYIPLNSDYIIELYDYRYNKYKYIQVNTGNENFSIKDIKVNFDEKIRSCIYYDDKLKEYKQFTTTDR